MRIMLDTNVLVSMILFPSKRFDRILKHITENHHLVLSSFVIDELIDVVREKFPSKAQDIDCFLAKLSYEFVYTPQVMEAGMFQIRDNSDYPVLYSAIIDDVDILITGDKDFLDVEVDKPRIMTPTMYIDENGL